MGCGKSTWGRKISRTGGIPFIDLDEQIVKEAGMSIADFFSVYGESEFRKLESAVLKRIPGDVRAVISTGGGAPCYFDNMEWMNQAGTTIYMKLPPGVLVSRLAGREGSKRPLLAGKTDEEMLSFVEAKLAERSPFYEQATRIVDVLRSSPQQLWDDLLKEDQ